MLERELKRKIVKVTMPTPDVDCLVHVIYKEDGKRSYQADMTVEEYKTRMAQRKLLQSMSPSQIRMLEEYLDAKSVSDEEWDNLED